MGGGHPPFEQRERWGSLIREGHKGGPARPQTWEDLDPMAKFLKDILQNASDAVDAVTHGGNGLTILIMISPNALGCAGYRSLPCGNGYATTF